jgi:hypothetical protein
LEDRPTAANQMVGLMAVVRTEVSPMAEAKGQMAESRMVERTAGSAFRHWTDGSSMDPRKASQALYSG